MNKRTFYALVSLSVLILLLGSSFLYFDGVSITGNGIFFGKLSNTKLSTYSPVFPTSKTSCVDYGNKIVITTPSTSTTRLKTTYKTRTLADKCLNTKTLQDYYCKKEVYTSTKKVCDGYCENGKCKKVIIPQKENINYKEFKTGVQTIKDGDTIKKGDDYFTISIFYLQGSSEGGLYIKWSRGDKSAVFLSYSLPIMSDVDFESGAFSKRELYGRVLYLDPEKKEVKIEFFDSCSSLFNLCKEANLENCHMYCHYDAAENNHIKKENGKFFAIGSKDYEPIIDVFLKNNEICYNKVKGILNFEPTPDYIGTITQNTKYNPGLHADYDVIFAAGKDSDFKGYMSQVNQFNSDLQNGNCLYFFSGTHEMTHIFTHDFPIPEILSEGLAQWVQIKTDPSREWFVCKEEGYSIINDPTFFMPYVNIGEKQIVTDIQDYTSGYCFWKYIEDNYGKEAAVKIVQRQYLRKQLISSQ